MIKQSAAVFTLLLCASAASAQKQEISRKIWVAPQGFVRLFHVAGTIQVQGWDQDSMQITGSAVLSGDGEFVLTPGKQGAKASLWGTEGKTVGSLIVRVPRRAQLWVKTQEADVSITDFEGGIDVMTGSGDVEIAGRPREVYVESMGGDVNVAAASRSVRIKTGTGAVTLRGAADEATISTVSGAIFALDTRIRQGRIESVEGRVLYQGDIASPSSLEFVNHAGAVDLLLPPKTSGEFRITTIEGGFRDAFGVRLRHGEGKLKGREFTFTLGSMPDSDITIRTFKGQVTLRKLIGKVKA